MQNTSTHQADAERFKYWDEYYSQRSRSSPEAPSQFAAFIASEFGDRERWIVDIGCGSGRDSLFYASMGFSVVGVDASREAVAHCNKRKGTDARATFIVGQVGEADTLAQVRSIIGSSEAVWYSRFFLHAITDMDEERLLATLGESCPKGTIMAHEFRTNRDAGLAKVTQAHFRRFICPLSFMEKARSAGFDPSYFAEGFGFAKFLHDDAHVARFILQRR